MTMVMEDSSQLETIVIPPQTSHQKTVIWLHGLGADGSDFVPIVEELNLPKELGVKFIFPHAPVRPVTFNGGVPMRAWFDIHGLLPGSWQDEEGILDASRKVSSLIEQEHAAGIPYNKILIAGFSQGGALALYTGLKYSHALAGILGLSTVLPVAYQLEKEATLASRDTPIALMHGTYDPVISIQLGEMSRDWLIDFDYKVRWQVYPIQHTVSLEEIKEIKEWLFERLQ